ncbi:ferric reductase transmembrane component [Boeremia exigua]|uniref:ferric reductase transmembrane component n=1 Tax=Boeremia exigua TaxID=749465 RepID=UPI001E8CD94E|nr:ferric reductase transmembrane component [Boeremia exigua]KAH6616503.1 ferric reductase transmembrane component [Boeremia exigua]
MADARWSSLLRAALAAAYHDPVPTAPHTSLAGGGKLVDPDDPGKDPRFRALVEAILFGRRFLKTYNAVLLGVLLLITAWHWGGKGVQRWRARRGVRSADAQEAWSSSSSTLSGAVTPPPKDTEDTPLLGARGQPRRVGWARRVCGALRAVLQYQPQPLPVVNKTMPANGVTLVVLLWTALIVFYNLYRMPLSFLYLFVFADRCGIIFISNLPLLYLLAAKNQPIKLLTGYSYESLNVFHRRVGEVMCLEAFLHFLGMNAVWYGMLRHLGFTLAKFLFNRVVMLGLLAFIAYELIYFTSLGSFRQRWYEVFLALHIGLQVAGLAFLWFHHYTSRPYVGAALAIFLVDRLVYRLWLKSSTHPATLTVMDDDETVLVSADWAVSSPPRLAHNMHHGWAANEHIFLTVPALSRKHALQSHPFTIFSAAPPPHQTSPAQPAHAWFSLLVRAQADPGFTRRLLEFARTHTHTRIRLDGPYGSPHALAMLRASSTAVLVAGGSGIAVAYPLLYALLQPARDDAEATPARKVRLLWVSHSPAHRLWMPEEKLAELQRWGLDVVIPPPTAEAGRPDVKGVVGEWVDGETLGRVGVVVSGPEGLVRDVRNMCAAKMWQGRDVEVAVEKFGW